MWEMFQLIIRQTDLCIYWPQHANSDSFQLNIYKHSQWHQFYDITSVILMLSVVFVQISSSSSVLSGVKHDCSSIQKGLQKQNLIWFPSWAKQTTATLINDVLNSYLWHTVDFNPQIIFICRPCVLHCTFSFRLQCLAAWGIDADRDNYPASALPYLLPPHRKNFVIHHRWDSDRFYRYIRLDSACSVYIHYTFSPL